MLTPKPDRKVRYNQKGVHYAQVRSGKAAGPRPAHPRKPRREDASQAASHWAAHRCDPACQARALQSLGLCERRRTVPNRSLTIEQVLSLLAETPPRIGTLTAGLKP